MSKHVLINEVKQNMRGGEEDVTISHILKEDMPNHLRLIGLLTLTKGASIGEHIHENESEVFYISQGCGKYLNEGEWIDVKKGDVLLCQNGSSHSIVNNTEEDLVVFATIILA